MSIGSNALAGVSLDQELNSRELGPSIPLLRTVNIK